MMSFTPMDRAILEALRDDLAGAGAAARTQGQIEAALLALTKPADVQAIGNSPNLNVALSTISTEATLAKLIPITKADIFNTALPAAEANWLVTDIIPTNTPSFLRLYVAVSVLGILRIARTIGVATITEDMNAGTNLTPDAAYMFTVEWRSGDSINFRYSTTGGTIKILRAVELGSAT